MTAPVLSETISHRPASARRQVPVAPADPAARTNLDRALEVARTAVARGGMVLTAQEALLVSRYLLYALRLPD